MGGWARAAAAMLLGTTLLAVDACQRRAPGPGNRGGSESDDEITPVYPIDKLAPLPLAARYCAAVRETPRRRREACCPTMGAFAPTQECTRTLSAALRAGAVTLDGADLNRCVAAVAHETEGCDWVTSVAAPTVSQCRGILKGTRPAGAACRSNLECEEGLSCHGLGATQAGRCGPPLPPRSPCNLAIDSLAVFSGQDDFARHHPECEGYCRGRSCLAALALGASCSADLACGTAARCVAGRCSQGALPAPRPSGGPQCPSFPRPTPKS